MTLPRRGGLVRDDMGTVDLPVQPPLEPMLAKAQAKVPDEAGVWSYEPKWDGFRALVFRDGDDVVLQSRNGKELGRYFPELLDALRDELAPRCVLDGEIVVPREIGGRIRLDWESLSPAHPSRRQPGQDAGRTDAGALHRFRRAGHRRYVACWMSRSGSVVKRCPNRSTRSSGVTSLAPPRTPSRARSGWTTFEGAGLDGVIAKKLDGPYLPGKREMVKVKHARDADCVAIGYRIHKSGEGVGSILLGLYRDDGELQMVGGAASFTVKDRLKLLADLEPLREGDEVRRR